MNQVDWLVIMFDEVHKIKDRKTKLATTLCRLNCLRRYGLTGTVVQNKFVHSPKTPVNRRRSFANCIVSKSSFEELHTLLDFVQPGAVGTLNQFRTVYINPIKNGQRQLADFRDIAYRRYVVRNLNIQFKKIVLRRDKSVIKDLLPPKTDNIVFCQMSTLQLEIYKRAMQSELIARMLQWVSPCPCERFENKTYGKCCGADEDAGDLFKELFPTLNHLMKISNGAPHATLSFVSGSVHRIYHFPSQICAWLFLSKIEATQKRRPEKLLSSTTQSALTVRRWQDISLAGATRCCVGSW
jgi:DNA excision repair protein ERCC-6-like 2